MFIVAVLSNKGGSGKTTLAINLAVASELARKPAVLIDIDPQASAKSWHDNRHDKSPPVISAQASRLSELIETAKKHGAALVIIDTPPHSETASLAAARAADLILIPCRPGILDIRAISTSADLAALSKTPAIAVLTACPHRGSLPDEATTAIKTYGLPVAPVRITHRSAFIHSLTASQAVLEYDRDGRAGEEIKQLYKFTIAQLHKPTLIQVDNARPQQFKERMV
jgi:chromosome partitioning protein